LYILNFIIALQPTVTLKESINHDDMASARDFAKMVSATSTALDDHIFVILQNHLLVLV